ncbi:MAG TPA: polysaccharide deacetylase family protein [Coriobacteriia bacterium]|nr:polysaccharide deacetylase family protein [Coriobacteriia bacterium]
MGRLTRCTALLMAFAVLSLVTATSAFAELTARPQLAVTFDDAPISVWPLLSTLQAKEASATFFLVGADAEANPTLAVALVAAGMPIGSHSYDHAHFASASADEIRANLSHAQTAIHDVTGITPYWYRSPYLDWSPYYPEVLPQVGLKASWPTINPKDWSGTPAADMVTKVVNEAAPGAVVILHDMTDLTNTVEALPGIIDGVRAEGYDFASLDDLGLGALEGTVTASGGLEDAVVTAYDANGAVAGSCTTGADGGYRIPRLAEGLYRVGMKRRGYIDAFYGGATRLTDAETIMVSADYTIAGASISPERDIVPPTTSVSGVPSEWATTDVTFTLAASDDYSTSGMRTWYRVGTDDAAEYSSAVTVGREGTTLLAFWSIDGIGNIESGNTRWVRIDKSVPVTTADTDAVYSNAALIELRADDAVSGVGHTYYSLDGADAVEGTRVAVASRGRHQLTYWSVDNAGNQEPKDTLEFAVLTPTRTSLTYGRLPSNAKGRTFFAKLTRKDASRTPVVAQLVRLQRLSSGRWRTVASVRSDRSGVARFGVTPKRGVRYRAVFGGKTDYYRSSTSGVFTLR